MTFGVLAAVAASSSNSNNVVPGVLAELMLARRGAVLLGSGAFAGLCFRVRMALREHGEREQERGERCCDSHGCLEEVDARTYRISIACVAA